MSYRAEIERRQVSRAASGDPRPTARTLRKLPALTALVVAASSPSFTPASAQDAPRLEGVWSTTTTAIENPAWSIDELFACACTADTYQRIAELLHDPANEHLSATDIMSEIRAYNRRSVAALFTDYGREYAAAWDLADDPSIQCEPFGAFRSLLHADPIKIEQYVDRVVIRGEDMASDRTIYIDGRDHPSGAAPTLTGHSIGWYEGSTLVVETVDVRANVAEDQLNIHNSDQARSIERYTLSEDGTRLHLRFTLEDPVMFRTPVTLEAIRLFTPQVDLQDLPCEAISGQP
jgi:hypothetical protein